MPDRILRERLTSSPELDVVSAEAERLFCRQMVRCDDYGRFEATPAVMLAQCFPLRAGSWKPARLGRWRDELAAVGLWDLYEVGGRLYGVFRTWGRHQRKRDSRPKHPGPDHPQAQPISPGKATFADPPPVAADCGDSPPTAARARDVRGQAFESRESRVESRRASGVPPPAQAHQEGSSELGSDQSNGHRETGAEPDDVKRLIAQTVAKLGGADKAKP